MKVSLAGSGCVSAAGMGKAVSFDNYREGKVNWSLDAVTGLPVYRVADLPVLDKIQQFTRGRQVDRATLLALHAAEEAVAEAKWPTSDFAIVVGCSRGPTHSWERTFTEFTSSGSPPVRTSPDTTLGSIGFALADFFGSTSLADGMSVTCSSGFHALLHGIALLRSGMVERVLVGGTEAPLTPFTLRQMQALRVYATPTPGERFACRPLVAISSGMVVGEGAAFVALQADDSVSTNLIAGFGFARESIPSTTGISQGGDALVRAMLMACGEVVPDLIIAHAPGTKRGDMAELSAIARAFPGREIPVTSLKYATGHTFGASGPLAAVAALSMLRERVVFPPYLSKSGKSRPETVLINATGFGGNAISVLLR